jgi:hypothetical protein
MTQEQKRIKLANYAGWHEKPEPHGSHNATAWWHNQDRYPSYLMPVPDYFNDLNAVHELEKALTEDQYDEYRHHLGKAVGYLWRGIISATAAQRAEALGKAFNLW